MTISPSQPIINAVPIPGKANGLIKNNNHIPVRVSNISAGSRRASLGNKTVPSAARGGRRYSWHGENVLNEVGGLETRHIQDSAPSQTQLKPGDFSVMYRQNRLNALYASAGNQKEKLAYLSKNAGNRLVASHLEHIANAHYLALEFGPNEQQRAELDNIMHQLTKLMIKDGLGDNSVFGSYQIDKKGMCEKREKWEAELVRKLNEIIGKGGEKPGDRLINEKIRPFIDNLIIQQTGRGRSEVAAKTTQQLINEHAYRGMQNIRSGIEDYKVSDLQKIFHDVEMVLKLPHLLDNEYVKQYPVLPPRSQMSDDEHKSEATGDNDPLHNKKTDPENDRGNSANQPNAPVSFTYAPVTTFAPVFTYAPNIHFPPAAATGSDKGGNVNHDTFQTNVAAGDPHQARVHGPVSPNTANIVGSSIKRLSQVHNPEPLGKGDANTTQADITTGLIGRRSAVQGNLAHITPSWKTHHHTLSPGEPDMAKVLRDAKAKLKKITPTTGHPTAVSSLNATLVEARRKLRPVYQVQPGSPSADKPVRETARLIVGNIANSAPTLNQPVQPVRHENIYRAQQDQSADQTNPLYSRARSLTKGLISLLNFIPELALNARKVQAHERISSIPDETSAHNLANRDAAREQEVNELNRLQESLSPPADPMSHIRAGIPNTGTVDKASDENRTKFTSALSAVVTRR